MAGYLIRGATVYDGTGAPGRITDVVVEGERIAQVGAGLARESRQLIDGDGLALAPGFIDIHSHSDFTLPVFPAAANSITQGCTTEVIGNCGFSPAPVADTDDRDERLRALTSGIGPELDFSWRSFGEYLDALDDRRPAVNVAALVGHASLRIAAMGMDDRPATEAELRAMRTFMRDALREGAWGLSTGLVYPPGSYGGTDEVIEIGRELAPANALYASHVRNESDHVREAIEEALHIGRSIGARVEISHLKAAGGRNHGRMPELTGLIEEARDGGLDVHSDGYPYDAGSTLLNQLIPPWAHDGGMTALVERLRSPDQRRRMRHDIEHGIEGWQNLVQAAGAWDRIIVASVTDPSLSFAEGRTVAELAARDRAEPLEWTMDFLVRDQASSVMIIRMMNIADVDVAMQFPFESMGSDQLAVVSDESRVHPRCYGTFARFIAQYVRERALVAMEEAVRRMTSMPAAVVGITDRGRIARGLAADLVLFDPSRVRDTSTYEQPTRRAEGVEWVFVNGRPAVAAGELVARDLGRVLRRPASA